MEWTDCILLSRDHVPTKEPDKSQRFAIGRLLAEKVTPESAGLILLVIVAGGVIEVLAIRLNNAVVGYLFLGLCLAALIALVVIAPRRPRGMDTTGRRAAGETMEAGATQSAETLKLGLANDAEFSGGTTALTDLLLRWREVEPRVQIRVEHASLIDNLWRVRQPDHYLRLRKAVQIFEQSVNAALTIPYYRYGDDVEWQRACVIRLRDIVFMAPTPQGEHWFAWEQGSKRIVPFDIGHDDVRSIRSGYYEHPDGRGIEGLQARPIWLVQIAPVEVWSWIIPAVVVHWMV
jgi:hypothetical protein